MHKFEAHFIGPTGDVFEIFTSNSMQACRRWVMDQVHWAEPGDTFKLVENEDA